MSQLNIYVPKEVEDKIRIEAKKEGISISNFLSNLIKKNVKDSNTKIELKELFGKWEGDFPEIDRPIANERDEL